MRMEKCLSMPNSEKTSNFGRCFGARSYPLPRNYWGKCQKARSRRFLVALVTSSWSHVNLSTNSAPLHNPKVAGAHRLLRPPIFDAGNCVLGFRDIQELRGRINHWANTGRIWKWLIAPANRLLAYDERNSLWIRCKDASERMASWGAIQFARDIVQGECNCVLLFTRVFSEIVGIVHELALPCSDGKMVIWLPADGAPSCMGGINWETKEFFATDPPEFIAPLPPPRRKQGHISEIGYLSEVLRTAMRSTNTNSLIICGLEDSMCANMWISSDKEKHGVSLTRARMF